MEIRLTYFRGIIENERIEQIQNSFDKKDLKLSLYDRAGRYEMSLEDLISQIYLTLSPALVHSVVSGLLTNVSYDALKESILSLSEDVRGKTYHRRYSNGYEKEVSADFGIKFRAGHNEFDLQMSPDLDSSLKEKCIEEAFSIMKVQGKPQELSPESMLAKRNIVGRFNESTGKWELIDLLELINQKREDGTI